MKTKEELNALKNEALAELNEEELKEVTGGGESIDLGGNCFLYRTSDQKFMVINNNTHQIRIFNTPMEFSDWCTSPEFENFLYAR